MRLVDPETDSAILCIGHVQNGWCCPCVGSCRLWNGPFHFIIET